MNLDASFDCNSRAFAILCSDFLDEITSDYVTFPDSSFTLPMYGYIFAV